MTAFAFVDSLYFIIFVPLLSISRNGCFARPAGFSEGCGGRPGFGAGIRGEYVVYSVERVYRQKNPEPPDYNGQGFR